MLLIVVLKSRLSAMCCIYLQNVDFNPRFLFTREIERKKIQLYIDIVKNCLKSQNRKRQTLIMLLKKKYKFVQNTLCVHFTVKKLNTPEYRYYLKLWNQETKPKFENTKDLPKLNQVRLHQFVYR